MNFTERIVTASDLVNNISAHVVTPLLILFAGIIIGKILRNITYKLAQSIQLDKYGQQRLGYSMSYADLLAGSVSAITYTITIIWALVLANIVVYVLWAILIFLGLFGVLASLLAVRDFGPDLWAGRIVKKHLEQGKKFSCAGVRGTVERIGLLDIRLRGANKELHVIANRTVRKAL